LKKHIVSVLVGVLIFVVVRRISDTYFAGAVAGLLMATIDDLILTSKR
jgi:hypothetical protein